MTYTNLDTIVRSVLMRRGYPLHWYVQFLKHSADALRELGFDTLKNVEAKVLPVSKTGIVKLPCDYVDWVRVGKKNSQYIKGMIPQQSINRLVNRDSQGNAIDYPMESENYIYGGWQYDWGWNNTTLYGANAGTMDGFKELRERGEIQLVGCYGEEVVLEYIGSGHCPDNATKVNVYAQATIEAYIVWQLKAHNRSYNQGDVQLAKREYETQHKILRRRLSPITCDMVINIFNRHKTLGPRG